ncbi:hypothetical protein ACXHXG_09700 [Rhizobium sp. LEGMi198b]|uniref:hypothetical protein n=1 Tax=unclassified Rhizobium TaxID=2613769 RepID=UPI000CDF4EAC|nr:MULTISPECIES: hypothetical protein [Rhizobium]AVA22365.1 hypothetical protein NXC24_CH02734 [Rhizobium sp. NXC24]MDK4738581.1 hypothetical protein [Rhizobium sp. CNPSo 3464]UWU19801.1 hypothetical protein N2601_10815 [Rhizobium tropici]
MVKAHSFDGEIDKARAMLEDAIKGMDAANAGLGRNAKGNGRFDAINFPVEEALVRETIELLDRWKTLALSLVKQLDLLTAAADLQHRRLFDEKAGIDTSGLLGRRMGQGRAEPASIAADLDAALAASASLDTQFKTARPALVRSFRDCEAHLVRIIERRQHIDFEIEEVQRQADAFIPRIFDRRSSISSARDVASRSELEAEYSRLVAEQDALHEQERALQPGRTALQRLIDIYEELANVLNVKIAAVNAMAGKLAIDIEQRIALLNAVISEAVPPLPATERPARVAALIAAFEANVLAGHDLAARKARADDVFTRRLEPHLLAAPAAVVESSAETEPET